MDSMVDAIIQARINSTRLPGKVLKVIAGKPLLFYVIERLKNAKNILRVCADRPLLDPILIDFVIDKYFECNADYISTRIKHTFPEGLTIEVFKSSVLKEAFKKAKEPSQREHVTPYIYANAQKFSIASV